MKGVRTIVLLGVVLLAAAVAPLGFAKRPLNDFSPPEGFIPPPLNPAGVELQTKELAPGVYALLSGRPGVDNSGFVVGERGVLVIDAHINGTMARQIQAAVKSVTDKPILYLVNTNYHGDHTFGNYAFPTETLILAHWKTALRMRVFEHEKPERADEIRQRYERRREQALQEHERRREHLQQKREQRRERAQERRDQRQDKAQERRQGRREHAQERRKHRIQDRREQRHDNLNDKRENRREHGKDRHERKHDRIRDRRGDRREHVQDRHERKSDHYQGRRENRREHMQARQDGRRDRMQSRRENRQGRAQQKRHRRANRGRGGRR